MNTPNVITQAVEGVLDSEVDLAKAFETMKANTSLVVMDFIEAERLGIDVADVVLEEWKPDRDEKLKQIQEPRRRMNASRARIMETLLAETGGRAKLRDLNLNRGWDFNARGATDVLMCLVRQAYQTWLLSAGETIEAKIADSDEYKAYGYGYDEPRGFVSDRVIDALQVFDEPLP
jgi:hypothetical protein